MPVGAEVLEDVDPDDVGSPVAELAESDAEVVEAEVEAAVPVVEVDAAVKEAEEDIVELDELLPPA